MSHLLYASIRAALEGALVKSRKGAIFFLKFLSLRLVSQSVRIDSFMYETPCCPSPHSDSLMSAALATLFPVLFRIVEALQKELLEDGGIEDR